MTRPITPDERATIRALDAAEAEAEWLAVVSEHLPTRPDRETVRLAHHRALMPQVMSLFDALGGTQAAYEALLDTLADAVLALLPGRSEAEVAAKAWDEGHEAGTINTHEHRPGRRMTNPYREGGAS